MPRQVRQKILKCQALDEATDAPCGAPATSWAQSVRSLTPHWATCDKHYEDWAGVYGQVTIDKRKMSPARAAVYSSVYGTIEAKLAEMGKTEMSHRQLVAISEALVWNLLDGGTRPSLELYWRQVEAQEQQYRERG